jgi:REP element-mobilizing transposase RayT
MSASCARTGTEVWAYCQMRNHVHLVMVPQHADEVRSAIREAHRRFTVANWPEYLREAMDQSMAEKIHAHTRTGRPLGEEAFVSELEARLERRLRPQKRGPKPRSGSGK